jgi:hypothetical protein
MSKVISLFNTKHGVGKTTIAFNLHKFLRLPVYELEEDFFSYCNNLLDQKKYVYDFSKKTPPAGIYDLNSNDLAPLKSILKISDYILVPTGIDFKDLIKTVTSLHYLDEIKVDAKVIVLFNRLDPSYKNAENIFTKISEDFITSKTDDKFDIEFCYMRNNRSWFERNIEGEYFLDLCMKSYSYTNTDIYFSNYRILETLYQYLYYYTPIYLNEEHKIEMKKKGTLSTEEKNAQLEETKEHFSSYFKLHGDDDLYFKKLTEKCLDEIGSEFKISFLNSNDLLKKTIALDNAEKKKNPDKYNPLYSKRNKILHFAFKSLFNNPEVVFRKKVIKDFRLLLIALDEYKKDDYNIMA